MIKLEKTAAGILLPVHAQPKSRKNTTVGAHDGRLKIAVTQPPENGKANQALIKLLAKSLKLRRSQIQLISGTASSKKIFKISDVEWPEFERQIRELVDD